MTQLVEQEMQLVPYNLEDKAVEELKSKYMDVTIPPDDRQAYAMVMGGLRECREVRLAIDEWHKDKKAWIVKAGKYYDGEKRRIHGLLAPVEDHLKAVRQTEDDRKEAIKAEKDRIEQNRIDGIREKISMIQRYGLLDPMMSAEIIKERLAELEKIQITEEIFQEFTSEAQKVFDGVFSNVHNSLIARIKWEKEEKARKEEAERLDKQKAEQEEAQRKIDADKTAIQAEKDKIARDKRESEIKEKARNDALQEAKEKAESDEKERIAKEKAKAKEKDRKESLRPDKDKIIAFASVILNLNAPELKSIEATRIVTDAIDEINGIAHQMAKKAKEL